jgi:hypothetical protein
MLNMNNIDLTEFVKLDYKIQDKIVRNMVLQTDFFIKVDTFKEFYNHLELARMNYYLHIEQAKK